MKQNTPPNGQNDVASPIGKRILLRIGLGLLAVAGAVYLVWKWWQRRAEAESALPERPQRLVALPPRAMRAQQIAPPDDDSDSETRWASLPVILLGTAIITAIITVFFLLVLDRPAFFGLEVDLPQFGGSAFRSYEQQPPPIPVLQRAPTEDVAEVMAQQAEHLRRYGWVSEEEGVAHIPIERAMRLLVERGLPAAEAAP